MLATLVLVGGAGLVALMQLHSAEQRRLQGFMQTHAALQATLSRRAAEHARWVALAEQAWRSHHGDGAALSAADVDRYLRAGQCLGLGQGPQERRLSVIGIGTDRWPRARLMRYLALARAMSTVPSLSGEVAQGASSMAFFLDPGGQLLVMEGGERADVRPAVAPGPARAALFARLRNHVQAAQSPVAVRMAGDDAGITAAGAARIGLAPHPVTGRTGLLTLLPVHDGQRTLGTLLAFDSTDAVLQVLRQAGDSRLSVQARDGSPVLAASRPMDPALTQALRAAGLWRSGHEGAVRVRAGDRSVLAAHIDGTDWALVSSVPWTQAAAQQRDPLLRLAALASLLALMAWLLVAWVERRLLSPMAQRLSDLLAEAGLARALLQMAPMGLCLLDVEAATPVFQNARMQRLSLEAQASGLALPAALVAGHADVPPGSRAGDDAREFELSAGTGREGDIRHLRVTATSVAHRGRPALLCMVQDASRQREDQLRQDRLRAEAETERRATSRFLATMSHEIRTPLNGILGHLELFARSPLDDDQRARLHRITQAADSLLLIVNDILDLERIEAGRLPLDAGTIEPTALLEGVALLYAPLALGKGVELDVRVDPFLARHYRLPAARVEQVLRNLVSNAVKFTASGRIELRVGPSMRVTGLRIEVADSGIGLSAAQQVHVFEPFVQAESSITTRFGGSGLGLSLCRRMCRLMGGDIDVQSTPEVGSVFGFDVPAEARPMEPASSSAALAGRSVLLYSAVPSWREELTRRLQQWGAQVLVLHGLEELAAIEETGTAALVVYERSQRSAGPPPALASRVQRWVQVRGDGPLRPAMTGNVWRVSAYAHGALLDALQQSGPLPLPPTMATTTPIG